MLQALAEGVIQETLRAIGWSVLKIITLGRYRGYRPEDFLVEGVVGFGLVAGLLFIAYRWWL